VSCQPRKKRTVRRADGPGEEKNSQEFWLNFSIEAPAIPPNVGDVRKMSLTGIEWSEVSESPAILNWLV
jgi:hypothetical protein